MNYHTLLFDVDDTLLNFQMTEAKALNELFAEKGIELTPEVKTSYKALNHHLWREFEKREYDERRGYRESFWTTISTIW